MIIIVTAVEPGLRKQTLSSGPAATPSVPNTPCMPYCHTSSHLEPLKKVPEAGGRRGAAATPAPSKGSRTHRHRWLCSAELPHPVSSEPSHKPSLFQKCPQRPLRPPQTRECSMCHSCWKAVFPLLLGSQHSGSNKNARSGVS